MIGDEYARCRPLALARWASASVSARQLDHRALPTQFERTLISNVALVQLVGGLCAWLITRHRLEQQRLTGKTAIHDLLRVQRAWAPGAQPSASARMYRDASPNGKRRVFSMPEARLNRRDYCFFTADDGMIACPLFLSTV